MLTCLHFSIILIVAAIVWAAVLYILGLLPTSWDYTKPYVITLSTLTSLAIVFDQYVWHWKIFRGWLVNRPFLVGTWHVRLHSDFVAPNTKERIAPIDCFMVARQSYSTLSFRLFTSESQSRMRATNISQQDDGVFEITGIYQNDPRLDLRGDRSKIHHGALILISHTIRPTTLDGHYWRDRRTSRTLTLTEHRDRIIGSFKEDFEIFKQKISFNVLRQGVYNLKGSKIYCWKLFVSNHR